MVTMIHHYDLFLFLSFQLVQRNVTGLQWVASEAWVTASLLTSPHFHTLLEGTLGFSFPGVRIPGLKEFLLNVHPSPKPGMEFINMFWEEQFGCKLNFGGDRTNEKETDTLDEFNGLSEHIYNLDIQNMSTVRQKSSLKMLADDEGAAEMPVCTGSEDLSLTASSYTDVSQVRISYNVYKAVYAIAHALHSLLNCDSVEYSNGICEKHKHFTSRQVSDNYNTHKSMFICFIKFS